MNILVLWREQLTAKSLKTIGSLWWQNTREFFKILWPLVIVVMASELVIRFYYHSNTIQVYIPLIPMLTASILWYSAMYLVAHPTTAPKDWHYFRSHVLFILLIPCILIAEIPLLLISLRCTGIFLFLYNHKISELFFTFACFFVLDAKPSIGGYFRAITVQPLKFLVLNLPIALFLGAMLNAIEITANMSTTLFPGSLPDVVASLTLVPLVVVLCGAVYKLAIDRNREAYFG